MQNFKVIDEPLDPKSPFYPYYPSKKFYKAQFPVERVRPVYMERDGKRVRLGWETVTELRTTLGSYTTEEAARAIGQEKESLWCFETGRVTPISEIIAELKDKADSSETIMKVTSRNISREELKEIRGKQANSVICDDVQEEKE